MALDQLGQVLGELVVAAPAGYAELRALGRGVRRRTAQLVFGIEGAGSYGAGLCEHLHARRHSVVEVERPRRRDRRAGKSDPIDALAAAKRCWLARASPRPRAGGRGRPRGAPGRLPLGVSERTRSSTSCRRCTSTAPVACASGSVEGSGKQLERRPRVDARPPQGRRPRRALAARGHARPRGPLPRPRPPTPSATARELAELVRSLAPTLLDEGGRADLRRQAARLRPGRFKSEAAFARCNGPRRSRPHQARPSAID